MVLYYSGTGNSKFIAKCIASALETDCLNLNERIKTGDTSSVQTEENVILVTPTYAWRIPHIVSGWLGKAELVGAKRIWFVMDCGSEIGNAAKYNRELAARKALPTWARPKSLCRRIILLCSQHRTSRKQKRLSRTQSPLSEASLIVSAMGWNFPHREIICMTAL